ncbi:MAG: TonB family protein, partial [Campylobacterota bacterium]|nr:TonB family protein [Campylobacterota bacterium]
IISITMVTEKITEEEIKPVVKKVHKIKPIIEKKSIIEKKPIIEKKSIIEKKPIIKEKKIAKTEIKPVVKEKIVEKVLPAKPKVIKQKKVKQIEFDATKKEIYISNLYELLNQKKFYPKMAKRRKLSGVVSVSFTINKNGKIKDVFIGKTSGHSILDKAALKVLKSINTYKPIPDAVSMSSLNLNIPIKYSRT